MPANFAVFFKLFLPHIFVEVLTNRTVEACTISAAYVFFMRWKPIMQA